MKDERIRYDESFPHPILGTYSPRKVGMDILLSDGDDPNAALDRARKTVREWMTKKDEESLHDVTTTLPIPVIQRGVRPEIDPDPEYEKDKSVIQSFQFREDAEFYCKARNLSLISEIKQIVNSKPSKK